MPTEQQARHGSYRVSVTNNSLWPMTLRLQLDSSSSFTLNPLTDQPVSLQPAQSVGLYRLDRHAPGDAEQPLKPYLQSIAGSLDPLTDEPFQLPCACNSRCAVSQADEGGSHQGWQRHAVDFYLPQGSPVHAVSDGVVLEVNDNSDRTCTRKTPQCDALTNNITLLTPEGALLEYAHLAHEGSRVAVGDNVSSGDLIALSGNTGYSFGPHLHLALLGVDRELRRQTFPMRFEYTSGSGPLRAGSKYRRADCEN